MHDLSTRRSFLNALILGLTGLAGAVVSVPILAYLLSPLIKPSKDVWRDVGAVDRFRIGETVEVSIEEPSPVAWSGQTAMTAVWLRRDDERRFTAFAVNCTHLGCPVNWLQDAGLFLCPCHGGIYNADGTVAGGPPPRRLFEHQVRVQDGRVQVLTRALQVG
jgi:menaquinol-cytochrome c reductase iron-sulfur subunit